MSFIFFLLPALEQRNPTKDMTASESTWTVEFNHAHSNLRSCKAEVAFMKQSHRIFR